MTNDMNLKYMSVPLPEPILKEKWSGNFENARKRIANYLSDESTDKALRIRLELELEHLKNLEERYTVDEAKALEMLHGQMLDVSAESLEKLRMEEKTDWIYLNGKVMYLDSFAATLRNVYPQLFIQKDCEDEEENLTNTYFRGKEDGTSGCAHIHIRQELKIREESCREGKKITVHMPIPLNRDGISGFRLIECSHEPIAKAYDDRPQAQPTICFSETARKGDVFSLEYELDYTVPYRNMSAYSCDDIGLDISENHCDELKEEAPHIMFTPYIKELACEITRDETNKLKKARRIYDYVTSMTEYRFVRDYAGIDNIAEYCALNRRGDCGVMALLFITLCRASGIPAQWQSGLAAEPTYVGPHDWATFYVSGIGRLYADLSGGAAAYRMGDTERWNFFFGNVDPYRIPINNGFQQPFESAKQYSRIDPYDSQCGEIEYEDCGICGEDLEYKFTPIDIYLK